MFTIGTGVGGGLVLNGSLYRGATGAAPEVGHTIIGLDLTDGDAVARSDVPAARLARGAGLGPRARPAGAGRRRGATRTRSSASACTRDGERHGPRRRRRRAARATRPSLRCLRILGERLGIGIANAINTVRPARGRDRRRRLERPATCCSSPARDARVPARACPGVGTKTKIRLARHGPRAGVLGAALIAAQEYAGTGGARRSGEAREDRLRVRPCGVPAQAARARDVAALGHEAIDLGT